MPSDVSFDEQRLRNDQNDALFSVTTQIGAHGVVGLLTVML